MEKGESPQRKGVNWVFVLSWSIAGALIAAQIVYELRAPPVEGPVQRCDYSGPQGMTQICPR